jgi:hypothetical protein
MSAAESPTHIVRHFRQILLWPLQLMPLAADESRPHWQLLEQGHGDPAWYRVQDEFTADAREFKERHYKEFVAFLPYVQRFVYGESRGMAGRQPDDTPGDSALKVFRRHDVAAVRLTLHPGAVPLVLSVAHVDLCFFDDIDVALLNVEVFAADLPLATVLDLLYRFGRAYPTGWDEASQGVHNAHRTEWLAADGTVLAMSDSGNRAKFLSFACQHRAPCIASHWAFMLRPLALDPSEEEGLLRYRQIEYHRMPLMAYLAVDDPRSLARDDWLRLGLIATLYPEEALPTRDPEVTEFEARSCYDRYWSDTDAGPNTRFLCTGRAFLVVGDARAGYFCDGERGILSQFRHQYALLFLIAHFHRAALLVFSDRLVDAIHDLDIRQPESVHRFRRRIHDSFEGFLRFTHRYWFHELSERAHIQALYRLLADRLGTKTLYDEVKEELRDMSQYLDSDAQRRQSTTVVRLTVVTTFSLVGTVATGFLGMNIIAEADAPMVTRWTYFFAVLLVTTAVTLFTVVKSKQLSDLMDVLSDDRLSFSQRLAALGRAWRRKETRS